jgi:hypothetical protein
MSLLDHRRIDVPKSALAPGLFADHYRYGSRGDRRGAPLVCCWGGALEASQYEESRTGPPARLLRELSGIFGGDGAPDLDLLVLPNPVIEARRRTDLREDLARTFVHELLPRTSNPRPSAIGFLGYSAGACVVTCLALDLPAARAVGTLGGVGMAETLLDTRRPVPAALQFAAGINADDPLAEDTFALQEALARRGRSLDVRQGRGGHDLWDYIDNGLAQGLGVWMRDVLFGGAPTGGRLTRDGSRTRARRTARGPRRAPRT